MENLNQVLDYLTEYIPNTVVDAVRSGSLKLLSESRMTSVVFCSVKSFSPKDWELLQTAVVDFQQQLKRLGGTLRQVIQDDKGAVMIGAFGLPLTHSDADFGIFDNANSAKNAVKCAISLEGRHLQGVGVGTGLTYCGIVGSAMRCEYCIMGDCVNMSARLMSAASKRQSCLGNISVLIDTATFRACGSSSFLFENGDGIPLKVKVKGKENAIHVYAPIAQIGSAKDRNYAEISNTSSASFSSSEMDSSSESEAAGDEGKRKLGMWPESSPPESSKEIIFGRDAEINCLQTCLLQLPAPMQIVLSGQYGYGKSVILKQIFQLCQKTNFSVSWSACSQNRTSLPFRCLIPPLWDILTDSTLLSENVDEEFPTEIACRYKQTRRGIKILKDLLGDQFAYASVLNDLLPFTLPVASHVLALGNKRQKKKYEVLKSIFTAALKKTNRILLFDDIDCKIDEYSMRLLKQVSADVHMRVAFSLQPGAALDTLTLDECPYQLSMRLQPINMDAVRSIIKSVCGKNDIPEDIVGIVLKKSTGNPFFVKELCEYLALSNDVDTWRSTLEVDDSATRKLSAVLRARLDSLQPSARLYIKVASVLSHPLSSGASDDRESKEEVNENLIAKHDVLSSSEGIGSSFSARDLLNIIVNSKLDASLLEMSSSQVKSYVRETLNVLVQKAVLLRDQAIYDEELPGHEKSHKRISLKRDQRIGASRLRRRRGSSVSKDFVRLSDLKFSFKHSMMRECAYGLLLRAQRTDLHLEAALYFEQNYLVLLFASTSLHLTFQS